MAETQGLSLDTEPQVPLNPELLYGLKKLLDDPNELEFAVHGVELTPLVHGDTIVRPVAYESPYLEPESPGIIQGIAVVETEHGTYVGGGRVARFQPEGHDGAANEQTMPFVSWTATVDTYARQGRGTQRYKDLNALALEHFGQPLHSDPYDDTSPSARAVWARLVREGYAEEYQSDNGTRYRFYS